MPGLGEQIVTQKLMTPQDFQDRLWSYKGAAFGLEPLMLQSAWFRPHNRSEDVPGLYMVGAGTHPGAGVPGVLMSAKALETVKSFLTANSQTKEYSHPSMFFVLVHAVRKKWLHLMTLLKCGFCVEFWAECPMLMLWNFC